MNWRHVTELIFRAGPAALLFAFAPGLMAEPVSVSSPGQILTVEVRSDGGRAEYRVLRFGEELIGSSRLGFLLHDAPRIERNLELTAHATASLDETWEQPWGQSRYVRNHYNELRTTFTETIEPGRTFDVVFRVYDDGLGFRYEFPEQSDLGELRIVDELTEFAVTDPATAWWIPAGEWNRYEYLYRRTPLTEVTQAHTPITVRTADGIHIAFHEAALVDYSSLWIRRAEGQRLRAQLAPGPQGWKVRRKLPFHTPWRTIQIADSAGALYESSKLILNLNEPNALGDVSWVRPAKYAGIWWSLHLDTETWATGPRHGATTKNAKRYIDFAAEHGIPYLLIEGWNPGWDGDWFGDGWNFDFTRAVEAFDIEEVAAYGRERGVRLVGHHETGCAVSHYERQLDEALELYQRLGVEAIKTGYVCDAGQVERQDEVDGPVVREWHDGQWQSNHHLRVVKMAAEHRMTINAHEPVKDTGLRRTYPNRVTREGARGMEYNAWGHPPNPPEHLPKLVFTRMLSGPFDYTPGILSLKGRGGQPIESTLARQLAAYVVVYSPLQMVADLPENYAEHPEAFRFIKDVAVDWSETRVLNGEIGDYVTIARKDRASEDWYLGAVTDEHGRLLSVPLGFLDPGRRYRAEIYRDGKDAHWQHAPFEFVREQREVNSQEVMQLRLAPGGGIAIRFVPLDED